MPGCATLYILLLTYLVNMIADQSQLMIAKLYDQYLTLLDSIVAHRGIHITSLPGFQKFEAWPKELESNSLLGLLWRQKIEREPKSYKCRQKTSKLPSYEDWRLGNGKIWLLNVITETTAPLDTSPILEGQVLSKMAKSCWWFHTKSFSRH